MAGLGDQPRTHVELAGVSKHFGAVRALDGVSLSVARGSIHALVGENGAGKSTLLKILAGSLQPDRGNLHIDGAPVVLTSTRDALARGIGFVHQEMLAFPNLSVAANIFAGREITGRFGRLREAQMRDHSRELLARVSDALTILNHPDGLGIGARLVDECVRFARETGYRKITLWTNSVLLAARHIYKKAGFRLVHKERHHSFGHALVGETWDLTL